MIANYAAEIKIVIFQSVSERQYVKWTKIVQVWASRSTIFIFSPTSTQKLLNRFSPSFMIIFIHQIGRDKNTNKLKQTTIVQRMKRCKLHMHQW